MPTAPHFPSIPVPREDLKSLNASVLALKQTVEMLTGQDQSDKYAAHVFMQAGVPEAHHVGDLWLCTGTTFTFNIWDGTDWLKLADVAIPVEGQRAYLAMQNLIRRRTI
jgi:hypothetical protein